MQPICDKHFDRVRSNKLKHFIVYFCIYLYGETATIGRPTGVIDFEVADHMAIHADIETTLHNGSY